MLLAANYPFLDVVWTLFIFFAWIIWFMLLFRVIADIFRRHDIGGGTKTLWLIFVIILPFLGVFIYLISQSGSMAERDTRDVQASQQQFDAYVKSVAGGGGPAAEIDKAKQLLDNGTITQAEFDSIKAKALASG
jgi:predicted PurR-regulated permease PerM